MLRTHLPRLAALATARRTVLLAASPPRARLPLGRCRLVSSSSSATVREHDHDILAQHDESPPPQSPPQERVASGASAAETGDDGEVVELDGFLAHLQMLVDKHPQTRLHIHFRAANEESLLGNTTRPAVHTTARAALAALSKLARPPVDHTQHHRPLDEPSRPSDTNPAGRAPGHKCHVFPAAAADRFVVAERHPERAPEWDVTYYCVGSSGAPPATAPKTRVGAQAEARAANAEDDGGMEDAVPRVLASLCPEEEDEDAVDGRCALEKQRQAWTAARWDSRDGEFNHPDGRVTADDKPLLGVQERT
ncbi:hypothetical protein H9P43_005212 [Blastocladiella emersonii ATCC 22665]|nr:hypothetical protein H9P43_005212 [Blastocladiella emersonii ATCC 22665]